MIHGGGFSSRGGLPAIATLHAQPDPIDPTSMLISFVVSGVTGHVLQWTGSVSGAAGMLTPTEGTVTALPNGERIDVGTAFQWSGPGDAVVVITLTDTVTHDVTQQSLRVTVP